MPSGLVSCQAQSQPTSGNVRQRWKYGLRRELLARDPDVVDDPALADHRVVAARRAARVGRRGRVDVEAHAGCARARSRRRSPSRRRARGPGARAAGRCSRRPSGRRRASRCRPTRASCRASAVGSIFAPVRWSYQFQYWPPSERSIRPSVSSVRDRRCVSSRSLMRPSRWATTALHMYAPMFVVDVLTSRVPSAFSDVGRQPGPFVGHGRRTTPTCRARIRADHRRDPRARTPSTGDQQQQRREHGDEPKPHRAPPLVARLLTHVAGRKPGV